MKKRLLLLLCVLLVTVATTFAGVTYHLQEGFEAGIPTSWVQQTSNDTARWNVETLATRPSDVTRYLSTLAAAPQGENYAFERFVEGGRNAVVRLVTPAINFLVGDVYNPVLSFSYAQPGRVLGGVSNFDTLAVYYRTAANGQWTLLKKFDVAVANWKTEVDTLPNTTGAAYYQLAFEVTETAGVGAYLDDVKVFNASACSDPDALTIAAGATQLTLNWNTSDYGTDSWEIAVFDHQVNIDNVTNLADSALVHLPAYVAPNFSCVISSNIQASTDYYVYLRGTCNDNESGHTGWTWAKTHTNALVAAFPYSVDFSGVSSGKLPEGWVGGRSQGLATTVPGVLVNNSYYSLNTSNCLFLGANSSSPTNATATLSDGQYVYVTTPEVSGVAVNQLQVAFWASAYFATPGQYAPQVEVGVMSNPEDASTFVPIETIKIDAASQFKKAVVSLGSYTGAGKYIAFRAKGATLKNAVAIDDVVIDVVGVPVPSQLALTAITPSSMTIAADKHNAASWNVLVAEGYFRDSVPAAILTASSTGADVTLALPDSLAGKVVTVYAQGVQGAQTSAWSFPLTVRIPAQLSDAVPFEQTFTSSEEQVLAIRLQNEMKSTSTTKIPACTYTNLHTLTYLPQVTSNVLKLANEGNYFTLGYMPTFNTKELVFYLRGTSSVAGSVAVGVMTNPYDESSFEQLAVFEGEKSSTEYSKCVLDLDQYTGAGHYLAFKSQAADNYIQKIQLTAIPTCREVSVVDCQAKSNKAVLTWDANNMSKWQVVVSNSATFADTVANEVVTAPTCTVTGLASERTYYYKVNTICGTDTVSMYGKRSFTTPLGVPYQVVLAGTTMPSSLTKMSGLASDVFGGTAMTTTSSGWSVQSSASAPTGMGNNFKVNIYGTSCKYWLLTPSLALDVDPGTNVRLTFDAAWTGYNSTSAPTATSTDDKFIVAVSTDGGATWNQSNAWIWANDGTGNQGLVNDISNVASEIAIDLTSYAGQSVMVGFYGESTVSGGDNDFHVANIKIAAFDPNCPGVNTVSAAANSSSTATVIWTMAGQQSADVQVATSTSYADSTLVYNQTVTTSPVLLSGLESNTTYYVRVKQSCDPNATYKYANFKTLCSSVTPEALGVEDFSNSNALDCWSTGHTVDGSSSSSTDAHIITKTGFGKVLSMTKSANSTSYTYNDGLYAVLPELNVDSINHYQITFDAATTSTYDSNVKRVDVGILTDANDLSTMIIQKSINLSYAADSSALRSYVVNFSSYDGDMDEVYGKYVGFFFLANDSSNDVVIDNVEVSLIPTCPQVEEVKAKDITSTAATVYWSGNVSAYDVLVTTAKSVDSTAVYHQVVAADSVVLSGLAPGKDYYAFVRAICGASDTARWSPAGKFTTCYGVPFLETFDNMTTYQQTPWKIFSSSVPSDSVFNTDGLSANTSNSYRMSFQNIPSSITGMSGKGARTEVYSTSYNSVLESPAIDMTTLAPGTGIRMTVKLANVPYSGSSVLGDCSGRTLTLYVSEDGGNSYKKSNNTVWACDGTGDFDYNDFKSAAKTYTVDLSTYAGKSIALLFASASTVSTPDAYLYIDSVAINEYDNSCIGPKKISAEKVGNDYVVSWQKTDASDVYYEVSTLGDFSEIVKKDTVAVDSFVMSNWAYTTTYYVRAKTICGSDWIQSYFKTPNGLPFSEDFQASTNIPSEWTRWSGNLYNDSVLTTTTGGWNFSGGNAAGLQANHAYCGTYYSSYSSKGYDYTLKTPAIVLNNTPGNNVILSFDLALTSGSTGTTAPTSVDSRSFSVAVITESAVIPVMEWSSAASAVGSYASIPTLAANYEVDLTAYAGQQVMLAFVHSNGSSTNTSYSYIHMDNVKVQSINLSCLAPKVVVKSTATDSLSFAWNNADASMTKVQLSKSASFASVVDSLLTTDSIAGFGGLQHTTVYYARVKKLCGEDAESEWSEPISVMTDCGPAAIPFSEDFEDYESYALPTCWTKPLEYKTSSTATYSYPYVSTSGYMYLYGGGASSDMIFALPEMAQPLSKLTLSLNYKASVNSSSYTYGTMKVGYYTDLDSAFVQFAELPQQSSATDYEVVLANMPAAAKYLAIRYNGGSSNYGYGYIYSLGLDVTPTCLPIKSINFANAERRSVDINWVPKLASNSYDLVISDSVLTDSLLALATPISVDTTFYHASALTRGTTYYVYVRSNCGAEDGVGAWLAGTFKTKSLSACESVTAASGTASSTYAPVYGYYVDNTQKSQSIYPASMLTDLVGKSITGLKYYVTSGGSEGSYSEWGYSVFNVKLANVSGESLVSGFSTAPTTTVYNGSLSASVDEGMVINFSTPFTYTGGDLLIEFEEPSTGTGYNSCTFASLSMSNASRYQYSSYSSTIYNYLPKVDFTYCYATPACPAVDSVSAELLGDGTTSAKISWSASEGDYTGSYVFCYADNDSIAPDSIAVKYEGIDSLSIVLTGLTENTQYYGYVKAVCDAEGKNDGVSAWTPVQFLTNANCPAVVDLTAELTGKNSAKVTWNTVFAEQEKSFSYLLSDHELSSADLAAASLLSIDTTVLSWDTLSYGKTYYLYVASRCDVAHSTFKSVSFTQPASCPAVQNLHATNVAFNAVELAWSKGLFGEENQWEVGIVGREAQAKIVSDTTALLIGLDASTDYVAYVKAICSATDTSAVSTFAFTSAAMPADGVEIGSGSSTSSSYMPIALYYNYSISEQIYTAAEIGRSGNITSLTYHYNSDTDGTRDLVIYLKHVSTNEFSSYTAWEDVSAADEVFNGQLVLDQAGDYTINLTTPFAYNGTDNLLIVIDDNTGDYLGNYLYFATYSVSPSYQCLYQYNDNTNVDPTANPSVSGSRSNSKNQVVIGFESVSCAKVANLKTSNITKTSADVSWFPGGSEISWNTIFSNTKLSDADLATATCTTENDYQKHFSGLTEDTEYFFYVRAICSASNKSDWSEIRIVTDADCRAPKAIHVDTIYGGNVKLSWSNNATTVPSGYVVAYGKSDVFDLAVDSTYQTLNVTDSTVSLLGLAGQTEYTVVVAAACDAQNTSRWSSTLEFKTGCAAFDVPWSESFDGNPNLECWNIPTGTTLYSSTYSSTYVRSGNALKYATVDSTVTILPDFGDLNGLQLGFWYRMEGTGTTTTMGTFQAGYVTNASDPTSFVALVNCPKVYDYTEVEVPFVSGIPAGARPAIKYHEATSASWYAFIDDVRMGLVPQCVKPVLTSMGQTSSSIDVALGDSASYVVEISVSSDFAQLADSVSIVGSTVSFTNLVPGKNYYVRAKLACDATTMSDWSMTLIAKTAYGIPFSENFSEGLPSEWYRSSTTASDVFTGTAMTKTSSGGWSSQSASSSSAPAALGANMKLNIYGTTCHYWMVAPTLDLSDTASLQSVRLTFDAAWTKYNSLSAPSQTSTDDKFMVAVSTDGGLTWDYSNAYVWANDNSGNMGAVDDINELGETVTIDLTRFVGGSVTVGFYGESTVAGGDNDFHVANILIESFNPNCAGVASIDVEATAAAADVKYAVAGGSKDVFIQVATNESFANVIAQDTVLNDSTYHVAGLKADTYYYVRIKQLCGAGEESSYSVTSFHTSVGLPFTPDFSSGLPADWSRYSYLVTDANPTFATSDFTSSTSGWFKVAADTVINSAHVRGEIWSTTFKYWLVTPAIDLTANVGDGLMLNVDLGLTPYSSYYRANRNNGVDDRFMIVVSEDGGKNWDMVNATIWNNDSVGNSGDYSYNAIPEHGQTYRINMTKYAGKVIAIGFYGESTSSNADNYFHFGNIRLDRVNTTNYEAQTCAGYAYVGNGFEIDGMELVEPGVHVFSQYTPAADSTQQDQLSILSITVNEQKEVSYDATICEGEEYSEYGFHFTAALNSPTVRTRVVEGSNGCDSITIVHFTINPIMKSYVTDSVAKGDVYNWHGKEYTYAGSYFDTLVSAAGCDSIVTLYLTYKKDVSALNELSICTMSAMPNPVGAGQSFNIVGNFGTGSAVLRMHSLTGALIEEYTVQTNGQQLPVAAPSVPGAYSVSLQTTDKRLFRTKILVK